jgi:hypothetical protein
MFSPGLALTRNNALLREAMHGQGLSPIARSHAAPSGITPGLFSNGGKLRMSLLSFHEPSKPRIARRYPLDGWKHRQTLTMQGSDDSISVIM